MGRHLTPEAALRGHQRRGAFVENDTAPRRMYRWRMRRRALATTKILAVALIAVPSCRKPDPASVAPSTSAVPSPAVATTGQADPSTSPSSASRSTGDAPTRLLTLAGELEAIPRDVALARLSHFRPLCDEAGFPLVGNVVRKAEPSLATSELCSEVRRLSGR